MVCVACEPGDSRCQDYCMCDAMVSVSQLAATLSSTYPSPSSLEHHTWLMSSTWMMTLQTCNLSPALEWPQL